MGKKTLKRQAAHGDGTIDTRLAELKITREELQSTIDQLEGSNDQLKASTVEVMAANEEMETSKEELSTINVRLQEKVDELEIATNDMVNLLACTSIAPCSSTSNSASNAARGRSPV
jgi:two-component system CheB/CheR fusion protein